MNYQLSCLTIIWTLSAAVLQPGYLLASPLAEDLEDDLDALSRYSANGATVTRHPRERCFGQEAFKFLACGPQTSIQLSLMPGMYGSLEVTTTQGGQLAQWTDMLGAMSEVTTTDTLQDLARQAASQDGSSINIVIPLIDYGFTGSFNNAAISMNRASPQGRHWSYEAIGPTDVIPGPGFEFPLSGKVTIDEYTPTILRGSFSGGMVDLSLVQIESDDPTLPVHKKLSGTFNIIAPWRGDRRAQIAFSENRSEAARKDMGQMFPDLADGGLQNGISGGNSVGNGPATGAVVAGCDCSCNQAGMAPASCYEICAGTFKACKGEKTPGIDPGILQAAESEKEIVAEAEAELRNELIKQIETLYGNSPAYQEILNGYLESFDEMKTLDDKIVIYTTVDGKQACPLSEAMRARMKEMTILYCQ